MNVSKAQKLERPKIPTARPFKARWLPLSREQARGRQQVTPRLVCEAAQRERSMDRRT